MEVSIQFHALVALLPRNGPPVPIEKGSWVGSRDCLDVLEKNTIKLVKLAALVKRPPGTVGHTFTKPADSCNNIHGHYYITWPPVIIYMVITT